MTKTIYDAAKLAACLSGQPNVALIIVKKKEKGGKMISDRSTNICIPIRCQNYVDAECPGNAGECIMMPSYADLKYQIADLKSQIADLKYQIAKEK
jgi:hypothetical protein